MANDYSLNSKVAAISVIIEQQINELEELMKDDFNFPPYDQEKLSLAKGYLEQADEELGNLYV